jgi:hypothetical protein
MGLLEKIEREQAEAAMTESTTSSDEGSTETSATEQSPAPEPLSEESNMEILQKAGQDRRAELQSKAQTQYREARERREQARQVQLTQQEERAIAKRLARIENPNTGERGFRSALRYLQRKGVETGGAVARGAGRFAKGTGKVVLAVGKKAFQKATAPSVPSKTPVSYRRGPAIVIAQPQGYSPPYREQTSPVQEGVPSQRPQDLFGLGGMTLSPKSGPDYFGLGGTNFGGKVNTDMFGLDSLKGPRRNVVGKKGFKKSFKKNGRDRNDNYDLFRL